MTIHKTAFLNILFIIAIGCTIGSVLQNNLYQETNTSSTQHYPDAFVENVIETHMDDKGNIKDQFFSPYMWHYADDNSTDITMPHLIIYHPTKASWDITAGHARAFTGADRITLWQNVKWHQAALADYPDTTLLTDTIFIRPNKKYAETPSPLVVYQPGIIIHAIGAEADMNKGTLKLLANVRVKYDPNRKNL